MLSWRLARRFATACLAVALVLSGLVLTGSGELRSTMARFNADRPSSPAPLPSERKATPAPEERSGPPANPKVPEGPKPVVTTVQTPVPVTEPSAVSNVVAELPRTRTKSYGMVGVTWSEATADADLAVEMRTLVEGTWSGWQDLEVDDEDEAPDTGGRPGTEPMWVGKAEGVAVRVSSAGGVQPADIRVVTIDAGGGVATSTPALGTSNGGAVEVTPASYQLNDTADGTVDDTVDGTVDATPAAAAPPTYTPKPSVITRSSWGASGGTYCSAPQTGDSTHGVVMHHSAGNNSYAKSDSPSIVRAVQAYHTKGHGWCDIGYNFLVDKYGQIFEGRKGGMDRAVRAAHSGNGAVNTYSMGVSMMGNYDTTRPSSALKEAVTKLVGWRLGTNYLAATGTYREGSLTLNRIAGHRNVVGTACPGRYGYAWLSDPGGLRDSVETYISNYRSPNKTRTAALGSSFTGPVYVGEYKTTRGRKTRMGKIDMYSRGGVGTYYVADSGGFRTRYGSVGAQGSPLGFPSSDSPVVSRIGMFTQAFQSGSIYAVRTSSGTTAYAVWGPADELYEKLDKDDGPLGMPKSSVSSQSGGQTKVSFTGGYILTSTGGESVAYTTSGKKIDSTKLEQVRNLGARPTDSTALLFWTAVPKAESYQVCLMETKTQSRCDRVVSGVTGTRVTVTGLSPNPSTDYYAKARARAGSVAGAWSGLRGFNLAAASAPTTAPTSLEQVRNLGARPTDSTALLYWTAVPKAESYQVCLMETKTQSRCDRVVSGVTGTRVTVTGLSPNPSTDYYAKTRARAGSVAGAWSRLRGFNLETADAVAVPSSRTITLTGHGYGHGIGMSQYGAQGAAKQGVKYSKILSTYYPGTALATRQGDIRVLITRDTTSAVTVSGQSGLVFRDVAAKSTKALPTSISGNAVVQWRIVPVSGNGKKSVLQYRTTGGDRTYQSTSWYGDAQFEGPTSMRLIMPDGSRVKYRGALRSVRPSSTSTTRDTVNVLPIEQYVRGVVSSEMPSSWMSEALKAQSVAARTYGVRSMSSSRHYDICDTTSCQVYGGAVKETSATDAAIRATAGKILTYKGSTALTQFSSSSGGRTAAGSQPYLVAVTDPYDGWSGNANHTWTKSVPASTIERAYPSIGTLTKLTVTKRSGGGSWGGRVSTLTLTGSKKSLTITGNDARWSFGLKSNWFGF